MGKFRVVVTDDRYGSYEEENRVLSELGIAVEVHNLDPVSPDISVLKDADALLANLFPVTEEIILSMDRCRIISRYGVGYDSVDVEAAARKGIWVANVPDYSIEDVSDHALALILGCVRKIVFKDRMIRDGHWNLHRIQPSFRIRGRKLGLIGFGAIAKALMRKVSGLGLSAVLVHDPYVDPEDISSLGGTPASLEYLLENSDYVSIHVPLTDETAGMIGKEQFAMMKKDSILINTSRGPVIDGKALHEALDTGSISAAGIDVFEKEPLPGDSPLKKLDNIILSDHTGWYSEESIVELKTKAALNVLSVLKGEAPPYPVNHV